MKDRGSVTKTLEKTPEGLGKGELFAGRFELIEELGSGGMGIVYRAYDREISEEIALKVLSRHILHRNEQIFAVLVELVHPADVFVSDPSGQLDLVPEPVDGLLVEGDIRVKDFEGDLFANFLIVGAIDDAHAAGAELLDQFEPPGEKLALA